MEIVIDIEQELYEEILSRKYSKTRLEKAVANGTPLPEHHGRLIDADAIPRHLVRDMDEIDKQPTIIEGSESE